MKIRSRTEKLPRRLVHVGAPSSLHRPKSLSDSLLKSSIDSGEELFRFGSQIPEGRLKSPCIKTASGKRGSEFKSEVIAEL